MPPALITVYLLLRYWLTEMFHPIAKKPVDNTAEQENKRQPLIFREGPITMIRLFFAVGGRQEPRKVETIFMGRIFER